MRVVVDTNVYISFLLEPGKSSPPSNIVIAGRTRNYTTICSEQLIGGLKRKVSTKPYLASRILPSDLNSLMKALRDRAIFIDDGFEELPKFSRDRDDDFLVLIALIGRADYLVSGDPDLLDLEEFEAIRIVNPAAFVQILRLDSG